MFTAFYHINCPSKNIFLSSDVIKSFQNGQFQNFKLLSKMYTIKLGLEMYRIGKSGLLFDYLQNIVLKEI